MSSEPHVRFQAVSKSYPGVQALKDISFDVARGELHAIVGENGAGKSTLIKLLSGAAMPDSGTIRVKGLPFSPRDPKDSLRAGISTIYQVFNLLPDQSIARNIFLGKEPATGGVWLEERRMQEKTRAILATLDASHLSPRAAVRSLRVGEQQIVEIAKALLNNAELLIMDEPTSSLNRAEVDALFQNVRKLRQQGVTILYISHHLDEVFELADSVTVMRDGRHIRTGPLSAYTRESIVFDMIGREVPADLSAAAPAEETVILEVSGVGSGTALRDISFTVRAGEILAVAGLSGSGKTELAKALFGEIPVDAGSITLKGRRFQPSPSRAIQRGMIYLPEDRKNDSILAEQSIRRNIVLSILPRISRRLGILNLRQEKAVADRQVRALSIKSAGTGMPVDSLSGGNQQKVALARCLAADPEMLILAEPTQGIDVGVKFELYQFIMDQSRKGRGVLLVSSEIAEIVRLAHRVMVMREGRIAKILDRAQMSQGRILSLALGVEAQP
jgi:ABC-type sugar transport system ATPase subunit